MNAEELISKHRAGERDLRNVNLAWMDLTGADLSGSDLREASLHRVNLRAANDSLLACPPLRNLARG